MPTDSPETMTLTDRPLMGQALLFSPEMEDPKHWDPTVQYTGVQALRKRPWLKDAVIRLRAEEAGWLAIGKQLNCHHCTAEAIGAMFPEELDIERAKRVRRLRAGADKLIELISADPESVPPQMRGLTACQLLDKAELIDGRPTARVESTHRVDVHTDWEQVLAALMDPNERTLGPEDVREVGAEIGLAAGNVAAIGERPGGETVSPALALAEGASDTESPVSRGTHEGKHGGDTDFATDRGLKTGESAGEKAERQPSSEAREQGGAGGAASEGGPHNQIHIEETKFSGNGSSPATPASI